MSIQRELRRGTQAENDAFTGAVGETIYTTDTQRLVNHDGIVTGGIPVPNFKDIQNNAFISGTVGGTANTLTLTTAKAQSAYANLQEFLVKPTLNNTGATTINIDGIGVANVKKDDGAGVKAALAADDLKSGIPLKVIYDGADFIAQLGGGGAGGIIDSQTFLSSGTWTKPASGTWAFVQLWGGGASGARGSATNGASGGGGGGGAYHSGWFLLSDAGSTETIIIASGGASQTADNAGIAGGDSSFGAFLTAYGGGGGYHSGGGGGGGGGQQSAGVNATLTDTAALTIEDYIKQKDSNSRPSFGGKPYGGHGAIGGVIGPCQAEPSTDGGGGGGGSDSGGAGPTTNAWSDGSYSKNGGGGAGTGGSGTIPAGIGGNSLNGGGGGGGGANNATAGAGAGGTSKNAGTGGAGAVGTSNAGAGGFPSGGGGGSYTGNSGAGAAGKCIVIVI